MCGTTLKAKENSSVGFEFVASNLVSLPHLWMEK
jgi:hypothetical protein